MVYVRIAKKVKEKRKKMINSNLKFESELLKDKIKENSGKGTNLSARCENIKKKDETQDKKPRKRFFNKAKKKLDEFMSESDTMNQISSKILATDEVESLNSEAKVKDTESSRLHNTRARSGRATSEVKSDKTVSNESPKNRTKSTKNVNGISVAETEKIKSNTNRSSSNKTSKVKNNDAKVRIIPLGGVDEIGKNMTVLEYGDEIIVIDAGLKFPETDMLGIDAVINDVSYLEKNKDRISAIFITHGHEDHIGGLPYLLKVINVPVYATRLTLGLIEFKLREHKIFDIVELHSVKPRDVIKLKHISVEYIKTNHSIADSCALAISTPAGVIIHTGDFKVDYTPVDGDVIDLNRFAELGNSGVLALMADSTNVEREGYTKSESTIGASFEKLFLGAKDRIIVATFSSNIHRIQQIVDAGIRYNRKVAFNGRSMENVVRVARELGYLQIEDKNMISIDELSRYRDEDILILTTGSQGEPMAALSRMAIGEHRTVKIKSGDMVVLSSSPIPGNEKGVFKTINLLTKMGAKVIYEALADVHVSGHACREELKLIQALVKPKYFLPIHGEYRHLKSHADLSISMGRDKNNILIPENGDVVEISQNSLKKNGKVPSGQIFVDGLGVGDVGNIVLRDRKHLSQDGILTVVATIDSESGNVLSGPDIISRGFVFVKEADELMDKARDVVKEVLYKNEGRKNRNTDFVKNQMKEQLKNFLFEKTKRKPMIVPVIMEI